MRLPVLLLLAVSIVVPAYRADAEPADPDRPALLEAEQAFAQGRTEQALGLVGDYLAASPQSSRGYFLRAAIYDAGRDYARSLPDYDRAIGLDPTRAVAYHRRGVAHFMLAKIPEALADFDRYLELKPDEKPHHWQRGIALYYAGRYEEGARQFELHRTVNRDDVENAAWHFACIARWKGVDAARKDLIPVTGDDRIPMARVQEMLAGKATPDDVLSAAAANHPDAAALNRQLFYAHLYVGLYYEAIGRPDLAAEHLTTAAEKHPIPDYMHGVASVHVRLLKAAKKAR
ncbi:MAG TPA: tetratricopeptide repeat protein [Tepidisphaeraceae bacterium]